MKCISFVTGVCFLSIMSILAAQDYPPPPPPNQPPPTYARGPHTYNHAEVGVFGDLFRVTPPSVSAVNYAGLGARVGVNTGAHVALEAEMSYDFEQNYTITNGSGLTSTTYTAEVRPITGLFGPKFQFGTSGPFRAFIEAKGGFIDFSTGCNAPAGSPACFATSLSGFGGSSTNFAAFPGGGVEGFWGPFGFRADAGDEIWYNSNNGGNWYNNLRVTFGPTLRF